MISGKRVIAAMLTALMAVTFTANTAVSVYATGVTATENAQTIDAQSTDAQALTPEEQKAQELQQVYDMPVESNGYKDWPQGPGTYGGSRNCYGSRNGSNSVCQEYRCS